MCIIQIKRNQVPEAEFFVDLRKKRMLDSVSLNTVIKKEVIDY